MPVESTHICSLAGIPGSQNVMIVKHFLNGAHLVEKKKDEVMSQKAFASHTHVGYKRLVVTCQLVLFQPLIAIYCHIKRTNMLFNIT